MRQPRWGADASQASETLGSVLRAISARFSGRQKGPAAVVICFLSLTFGGCSHSEPGDGPPASKVTPNAISSSAQVVKVSTAPVSIVANGSADANVTLSISPGFHINANPATFPYLIATEVTTDKIEGVTVGKPHYPGAKKRKFQFADEELAVYEGEAQIKLPLRADSKKGKGTRSLPIHVTVQACDHEKCYPPSTLDTTIVVDVK